MNAYPPIDPTPEALQFLRIPIRPLISVIAVISIGYQAWLIYECLEYEMHLWIVPSISFVLDVIPLVGIVTNHANALKLSCGFVLLSILYATANFCVWPILISCSYSHNRNEHFMGDLSSKHKDKFILALTMGYFTETLIGIVLALQIFKFYLIKKLWKAVERMESVPDTASFDTIY